MKKQIFFIISLFISINLSFSQNLYFPDSTWQIRKPSEVKMNAKLLDSAVNFSIKNEVKVDYDLRIANLKSYVNEPNYHILGPMRNRGKSA